MLLAIELKRQSPSPGISVPADGGEIKNLENVISCTQEVFIEFLIFH